MKEQAVKEKCFRWWVALVLTTLLVPPLFAKISTEREPDTLRDQHRRTALGSYDFGDLRFHPYRFNTGFGINVMQGSAFSSVMQFGYAPFPGTPLYVGPEVNFSLFSPGTLLSTLAGAWYDFHLTSSPKAVISLGAAAGPGFSAGLPIPNPALVVLGELAIDQEIDDLTSVRAGARPGVSGGLFAFLIDLTISFRFR